MQSGNILPIAVGEKQQIKNIYREVARRVGLSHLNVEVVDAADHDNAFQCTCGKCKTGIAGDQPNMGIVEHKFIPNLYRLLYSKGITKQYDTWMLASTIAHELGHVYYGHTKQGSTPARELQADDFAAKHGYADGLRRVMEYNAVLVDSYKPRMSWHASSTHPALRERIWRLGQYTEQVAA